MAGCLVGNFPQAFSHVSLVNSASKIGGLEKPSPNHVMAGLVKRSMSSGRSAPVGSRHPRSVNTRSILSRLVDGADTDPSRLAAHVVKEVIGVQPASLDKSNRKAERTPTAKRRPPRRRPPSRRRGGSRRQRRCLPNGVRSRRRPPGSRPCAPPGGTGTMQPRVPVLRRPRSEREGSRPASRHEWGARSSVRPSAPVTRRRTRRPRLDAGRGHRGRWSHRAGHAARWMGTGHRRLPDHRGLPHSGGDRQPELGPGPAGPAREARPRPLRPGRCGGHPHPPRSCRRGRRPGQGLPRCHRLRPPERRASPGRPLPTGRFGGPGVRASARLALRTAGSDSRRSDPRARRRGGDPGGSQPGHWWRSTRPGMPSTTSHCTTP